MAVASTSLKRMDLPRQVDRSLSQSSSDGATKASNLSCSSHTPDRNDSSNLDVRGAKPRTATVIPERRRGLKKDLWFVRAGNSSLPLRQGQPPNNLPPLISPQLPPQLPPQVPTMFPPVDHVEGGDENQPHASAHNSTSSANQDIFATQLIAMQQQFSVFQLILAQLLARNNLGDPLINLLNPAPQPPAPQQNPQPVQHAPTLNESQGQSLIAPVQQPLPDDVTRRLDSLEKLIANQRGAPPPHHAADSIPHPLNTNITLEPYPAGFKIPQLETYDGTKDPDDHLHPFYSCMQAQNASNVLMCKIFPSTFRSNAGTWYYSLPPRSISSYTEMTSDFATKFSNRRLIRKTTFELMRVKQRDGESLKNYMSRFNDAVLEVSSFDQAMGITVVISGLKHDRFRDSLIKHPATTFSEVNDKSLKFITAEEYALAHNPTPSKNRNPEWRDENPSKKRMRMIKNKMDLRRLGPMKTVAASRDYTRYCDFHQDHGHTTEQCNSLRPQPQGVRNPPNKQGVGYQQAPPLLLPPARIIHMITGGLEAGGLSSKQRKLVSSLTSGVHQTSCTSTIFESLGLDPALLQKYDGPIYGFNNQPVQVEGVLTLHVAFGSGRTYVTLSVQFFIVKMASSFNVVIGRPTLTEIRAVVSQSHLCMKFPTPMGIATLRVLVKKANGKWRMCIDYTNLNQACPKDCYPMPNIDKLVEAASSNERLSLLDAYYGYHQVPMAPEDEEKTSFYAGDEIYYYVMMPFGLKNAGATYQKMVTIVLRAQIDRNLEVYVDDIVGLGAGALLIGPDGYRSEHTLKFNFDATNNMAEYETLLLGLQLALKLKINAIQVYSDSQLVVNQTNSICEVVDPMMVKYVALVAELKCKFQKFYLSKIPRTENEQADSLSKFTSDSSLSSRSVFVEVLDEPSFMKPRIMEISTDPNTSSWTDSIFSFLRDGIVPEDRQEAMKLRKKASRYTLVNGVLYKRSFSLPLLRCLNPYEAEYALREVHEGVCRSHVGARTLAQKVLRQGYYWPNMYKDATHFVQRCPKCQFFAHLTHQPAEELTNLVAPWPFTQWGLDLLGPFVKGVGGVTHLIVGVDYFTKWVEAQPLSSLTSKKVEDFVFSLIICKYGIPNQIVADNGTQFNCTYFRDFCETPYHLAFGTEAIISIEIGVLSFWVTHFDEGRNGQLLQENLDLLAKVREEAWLRTLVYKQKLANFYNKRVRPRTFKEGPYTVAEVPHPSAYILQDAEGKRVPRVWNINNVKKFYP
ncbi:hypothetical protein SLEP1_g28686 [Rubroshorea leprosula]|uniref:Uncharacterized protein n=1 Tax=Rubroshorea leprosula TaxID=152421 RepID=A0AAV5K569_9ROSI|nr:hypothetical protein SLEP1_g28686 [Rubroshorea leprosula]